MASARVVAGTDSPFGSPDAGKRGLNVGDEVGVDTFVTGKRPQEHRSFPRVFGGGLIHGEDPAGHVGHGEALRVGGEPHESAEERFAVARPEIAMAGSVELHSRQQSLRRALWPPPESSVQLSELQRDALGPLVDSEGWTINGARNSNWSMQIAEFLLPSSKAELQRYLDDEDLSLCIS